MRCAVLGDPIGHSLSPVIHRAAYAAIGLDWSYGAERVPSGGLAGFVAGLDDSWRGLSVTMPLKREALALGEPVTDLARLAGAANTLVRRADGWLVDNTDVPGAAAAIRERHAGRIRRTAIWGGGATATSAVFAAAHLGCRSIDVLARDGERAAETLAAARRYEDAMGARLDVRVLPLGEPVDVDLLVSTIPAAAQPRHLPSVHRAETVLDAVYDPWPTPVAEWATARGLTVVSGLDLLVRQAALQFLLFTGREAPVAAMRGAGERALGG